MVTDPRDYKDFLYQIQNANRQTEAIMLPTDEPLYEIDLNTRTIKAPQFLSVKHDHNSETVFFCTDRYYDNVDLSTMYCVVEYENAAPKKEERGYIYYVPYLDTTSSFVPAGKMIVPWVIQGPATAYAGKITFSVKFYRIREIDVDNQSGHTNKQREYEYVLNTKPAVSEILYGLDISATSENYYFPPDEIENIYQEIEKTRRINDIYWIIIDNNGEVHDPNLEKNQFN